VAKLKRFLFGISIVFVVSNAACSPTTAEEDQTFTAHGEQLPVAAESEEKVQLENGPKERNDQNLAERSQLLGVNIYIYRQNHTKPQPMLIDVLSDKAKLEKLARSVDAGTDTANIESFEGKTIYRLQLEYGVHPAIKERKDYLYVLDQSGKGYIKRYEMTDKSEFETFTAENAKQLLQFAGHSGWKMVSEPLIDTLKPIPAQ